MRENLKNIFKQMLPPAIFSLLKPVSRYGWSGNFPDWESAKKASTGYDKKDILNKVRTAALKVKSGVAAFERDSVLFYEQEYSWPLIASLMWIAAQNAGKLRVMDYGGALGSTFFQYKHLLSNLKHVKWCVVEQEGFFNAGRESFQDDTLNFYPDLSSCLENNQIDVVLLGCVLPYLETPFVLLEKISATNIPFLIIDRTPVIQSLNHRLTVQKVSPEIYDASYPAWFFSYRLFIEFIKKKYTVIAEYDCKDVANICSKYLGFILKLK